MKYSRRLAIATVLAAASGVAAAAGVHAWSHHHAGFGHTGLGMVRVERRIEHMTDLLGLTPAQRDKIRAVLDGSRADLRHAMDSMHDTRHQLRALMRRSPVDETQVRKLADQEGKALADLIIVRAHIRNGIEQVLTPQQRDRLARWHRGGWRHHSDWQHEGGWRHAGGNWQQRGPQGVPTPPPQAPAQ